MYRSKDDLFLILRLQNGVRYEEQPSENNYFQRQKLIRFRFREREQKFDLSVFKITRTDENEFRNASMMMNLKQINHFVDSANRNVDSTVHTNFALIKPNIRYFSMSAKSARVKYIVPADSIKLRETGEQLNAYNNAASEVRQIQDLIKNRADNYKDATKNVRRYILEYQKKFTIGAACIVLFLIGAPLGAIIRKGGLGMPVVVSVIFFLIYYIISTIGEKFVKEGDLSPVIGSWIAIAALFPIGIFLSYKAATDSALFDMDIYKRYFKRLRIRKTNTPA